MSESEFRELARLIGAVGEQQVALDGRLDRIEANMSMAVEGLRLVCQELGIRDRLSDIVARLPRDTEPAPPFEGESAQ